MPIQKRIVVIEGGEMKIKFEPVDAERPRLSFGEDRTGDRLLITGDKMAREVLAF